ncbi:MAG: hypothetical protein V4658_03945 [Bacteroidota bacterium]
MKNIFLILLLGFGINALAQATDEPVDGEKQKMEALKIAFITEKLNLTSKEAEVFWPVFNRYDKEVKTIRKKERESARAYSQKTNSTEQEADKFLTEQLALKQQEVDLLKKFIPEFKKVLPLPKVARLLSLEQEFKMQLLHKLKDRRGPKR